MGRCRPGWLVGADELFEHLRDHVPWSTSQLYRYDHFVEERRLGASWRRGSALPHPALAEATRWLQNRYRADFDGFSMIRYRDGRDGQAFHRDTDMRYLDDTVIAVLSLGAQRPWLLRRWVAQRVRASSTTTRARAPPTTSRPDLATCSSWAAGPRPTGSTRVPYLGNRPIGERISLQWRFANKVGKPYIGASYRAPLHYSRDRRDEFSTPRSAPRSDCGRNVRRGQPG